MKTEYTETAMITEKQLITGANFWWSEYCEKIIINKASPKMVWYFRKKANDKYDREKRMSKEDMLTLLNGCNFTEI